MKIIKGGICAAKGFFASATEANIKYKNISLCDMSHLYWISDKMGTYQ